MNSKQLTVCFLLSFVFLVEAEAPNLSISSSSSFERSNNPNDYTDYKTDKDGDVVMVDAINAVPPETHCKKILEDRDKAIKDFQSEINVKGYDEDYMRCIKSFKRYQQKPEEIY